MIFFYVCFCLQVAVLSPVKDQWLDEAETIFRVEVFLQRMQEIFLLECFRFYMQTNWTRVTRSGRISNISLCTGSADPTFCLTEASVAGLVRGSRVCSSGAYEPLLEQFWFLLI